MRCSIIGSGSLFATTSHYKGFSGNAEGAKQEKKKQECLVYQPAVFNGSLHEQKRKGPGNDSVYPSELLAVCLDISYYV